MTQTSNDATGAARERWAKIQRDGYAASTDTTEQAPFEINKQIAFFAPADSKGKYHAAWMVSHTAICGSPATLDGTDAIRTEVGQTRVHPILCRSCLRLTGPGYSALGVKR